MTSHDIRIEPPYRRKQTASFVIGAPPDQVFSMMCPVREYEWVLGWRTNIILSTSGIVEEGCMFTTPSPAGGDDAVWVTPFHDREARRLTMIKVAAADCVTRLDIAVDATADGSEVTVSYEHTGLNERGRALVDSHTEAAYAKTMDSWRQALDAAFA